MLFRKCGFFVEKMATKPSQTNNLNELLKSAIARYNEGNSTLQTRITHKEQGFNEYDNLYRSYIRKDKWPFNSRIFIPLAFQTIFSKGTRQITGKIKGKLNATQFGNELAARIGTEVLSSQYDDHDYFFEEPLISKWFRMDQNARKYGASFALVVWRREVDKDGKVIFDGPTLELIDNRKIMFPDGVSSISDSEGVIVERTAQPENLERINDSAIKKNGQPAYFPSAIAKLKAVKNNQVTTQNPSTNMTIRNLPDKKKGFRILTEYRKDYWITWTPDVGGDKDTPGLLLRVVKNPYKHGLIPIIRLVYIPIDDDIYGVSELEPVRSEQKATNALVSGFIEAVSTELYPIIKGHPTNVDWKTVEFKPRAAWLMMNPQSDLTRLEGAITFTQHFVEAYRLLKSSFAEGMGESAADASNQAALQADKTATEVKDTAQIRTARDNMNKLFLAAAVTKMYMLWWSMDQQFLTDQKVINVAGKEAIEYFINEGLADYTLSNEGFQYIQTFLEEHPGVDFASAYEWLRQDGTLEQFAVPLFPVKQGNELLPKLQLEKDGKAGFLSVENKDLSGQYRWTVDLNTIGMPNDEREVMNMQGYAGSLMTAQEKGMLGDYRVKFKELYETIGEKMKIHGADGYFEKVQPQPQPPQGPMSGQMPQVAPGQPISQSPMPNGPQMPMQQPNMPIGGEVTPQQLMGGAMNG